MDTKDGGAAFPETAWGTPDGMCVIMRQPGMSLRDYFAAQAMPEVVRMVNRAIDLGNVRAEMLEATVAEGCYAFADAMLKRRAE